MSSSLTLDFSLELDGFSLQPDVRTEVDRLSFFGPSGSGKSLLMDCIAGVRAPDTGGIVVGDRVLYDDEKGIQVPPEQRNVGYLMQSAPLFPHLDVQENITFGTGLSPEGKRGKQILEILGIDGMLSRSVDGLSGGEARRVALAQTLFSDPDVLLLDEPLVGLDTELRGQILPFLRRVVNQLDIPVIHVSHRAEEVLALSKHVIRIQNGETKPIQEVELFFRHDSAPAGEQDESTRSNVLLASVVERSEASGTCRVATRSGTEFRIPDTMRFDRGSSVVLSFHPGDLILARDVSGVLSPRNRWDCVVHDYEVIDGLVEVILQTDESDRFRARVTKETAEEMGLLEEKKVVAMLKTHAITVHPA